MDLQHIICLEKLNFENKIRCASRGMFMAVKQAMISLQQGITAVMPGRDQPCS